MKAAMKAAYLLAAITGVLTAVAISACGSAPSDRVKASAATCPHNRCEGTVTTAHTVSETVTMTMFVKPHDPPKSGKPHVPPGTIQISARVFLVENGYEANMRFLCKQGDSDVSGSTGTESVESVVVRFERGWMVTCKSDQHEWANPTPQKDHQAYNFFPKEDS